MVVEVPSINGEIQGPNDETLNIDDGSPTDIRHHLYLLAEYRKKVSRILAFSTGDHQGCEAQ